MSQPTTPEPDEVEKATTADRAAEYDVPPDAEVQECSYCGRPFPREDLLALHRGVDHPGEITDEERAAFEEAYGAESDDLRQFQIAAVGMLVLLYFGLLILYALV